MKKAHTRLTREESSPTPAKKLQAKLTVGSPNHPAEAEADQMAERVMRMEPPKDEEAGQMAQALPEEQEHLAMMREALPGEEEGDPMAEQMSEEEEDATVALMRKGASFEAEGEADVSDIVAHGTAGGGRPLDDETRAFMEPRFGHDFGDVRVHTDGVAAQSANDVRARAYTVGQDVVFREGEYAPGSDAGKRLLAHELTHVVQQNGYLGRLVQRDGGTSAAIGTDLSAKPLDVAFVMGKDGKPNNPFYHNAIKFFTTEMPDVLVIDDDSYRSLAGIFDWIRTHGTPIQNLYIITHASEEGFLNFPLSTGATENYINFGILEKTISKNHDLVNLPEGIITDNTHIHIKGCDIGENGEMLKKIDQAFGGKGMVTAPKHKEVYRGKTSNGKTTYYESLNDYHISFPGDVSKSKSRAEILEEFKQKYAGQPIYHDWEQMLGHNLKPILTYVKDEKKSNFLPYKTSADSRDDVNIDEAVQEIKEQYESDTQMSGLYDWKSIGIVSAGKRGRWIVKVEAKRTVYRIEEEITNSTTKFLYPSETDKGFYGISP